MNMNMLSYFGKRATLYGCALLLCVCFSANADELQDINKLFKQGDNEHAMERVDAYLANKPKDAQARFLKGLILTEEGKTNDAIRVFSDLTEDYPELPEPYNNLAVLYASQGQYDKARSSLELAIRTHPSYATAHENLGDIYAMMASQAYDRALQLDHANATTKTKLAMIKEIFAPTKSLKASSKHADAIRQAADDTRSAEPAATAAAPAVAAAPAETAARAPTTGSSVTHKRVQEWAAAWSSKDVKRYLAFYADDFQTPGGMSRASWEAQRADRIKRPRSIEVKLSKIKVKALDANHVSVSFRQFYRASHLKASSNKTLVMEKSGSTWLIQEERTGN